MGEKTAGGRSKPRKAPATIKKYANRRLYDAAASSYVTLGHLARMVREGTDFTVQDAKTGEDITRCVLTQIVAEEEAKGPGLLPVRFLRQLIGFYGDGAGGEAVEELQARLDQMQERLDGLRSA